MVETVRLEPCRTHRTPPYEHRFLDAAHQRRGAWHRARRRRSCRARIPHGIRTPTGIRREPNEQNVRNTPTFPSDIPTCTELPRHATTTPDTDHDRRDRFVHQLRTPIPLESPAQSQGCRYRSVFDRDQPRLTNHLIRIPAKPRCRTERRRQEPLRDRALRNSSKEYSRAHQDTRRRRTPST